MTSVANAAAAGLLSAAKRAALRLSRPATAANRGYSSDAPREALAQFTWDREVAALFSMELHEQALRADNTFFADRKVTKGLTTPNQY